jgi:GLPGLI family protein
MIKWLRAESSYDYYLDNSAGVGCLNIVETVHLLHNRSQKRWDYLLKVKIGDYLCYKAVYLKIYGKRCNMKTLPITAWFCPSLPGMVPNNIMVLPGLILRGYIGYTVCLFS